MQDWFPRIECSQTEKQLMRVASRSRKLFVFLREHRHELFDDSFQAELAEMYRQSAQGREPQAPGLMCMVVLLQGYMQVSDAEAVRLSASDRCWRMVLGTLNDEPDKPAFSQGGLQQFRERLIHHEMDRRLLERTIELAKSTATFDWKKFPKSLRVAVDSRPLEGAGRVEDTFNLLGHAGRKIVECMAELMNADFEEICHQAGAPLLASSSVKAGLDIDWSDNEQKADALNRLCAQLGKLTDWVSKRKTLEVEDAPLTRYIEALAEVKNQDLELRATGGVQIREGVAQDRRISIEDAEMRHGRKSKSKRFNGFKQHVSTDLDTQLILAGVVLPANRPEEEATPHLEADMARLGLKPNELFIDRGYINSEMAHNVAGRGGEVICKPWGGNNGRTGLFGKRDFKINIREQTVTCPAGQVEPFELGGQVDFNPEVCGACPLRSKCTHAASGRGRSVTMSEDEARQKKLRKLQSTRAGREKLRTRTGVEHRLAHVANRQGHRARYCGTRRNTFDLRRLGAIQNLETIARKIAAN